MSQNVSMDGIADIVRLQLGRREVSPHDRLAEDLGAVSMDLMHIAVAIEDRFDCFLDETDLSRCRTVADLLAAVERSQRHDP